MHQFLSNEQYIYTGCRTREKCREEYMRIKVNKAEAWKLVLTFI